ncbi:MAG: FAD-dependent thymidylate synthase [Anaerolineae bacterium]|nr:FAD-dependent thymidylate synthase [Anaerolineae bacterium]
MSADQKTKEQAIEMQVSSTGRPTSTGAEEWLGKVIAVLDHGFVYLVDYMGNDEAIEQAARVSYGRGTRSASATRGLIRYLLRHKHTTPFEMVELKFHAKMPIFVARQWIRHRTASVNEYSGRYSILDKEFYIPAPDGVAAQSTGNKQGREAEFDAAQAEAVRQLLIDDAVRNYEHYEYMLNDDGMGKPVDSSRSMLTRELARMDLTLNYYTQWYWKIDLHNLFHFLKLRMDAHAQYEIREYANAMSRIVRDIVPLAWEAFEDYELGAVSFSKREKETFVSLLREKGVQLIPEEVLDAAGNIGLDNKREQRELLDKLGEWGLLQE